MIYKSITPAMFFALLSNTALAGELVLDISGPVPGFSSMPLSSNPVLLQVYENTGNIDANIGSSRPAVRLNLSLGDVDSGAPAISNNELAETAAANANADADGNYTGNNLNALIFDGSSSIADAEALIGAVNVNTGRVTSTIDIVNANIVANDVTKGSEVGIRNNRISSLAVANAQDNYITGDMTSLNSFGSGGSSAFSSPTGKPTATGDVVIAAIQINGDGVRNAGAAKSTTQNINMGIDAASLGENKRDQSSLVNQGNEVAATTEVNHLNNVIDVEDAGLELNFVIAATQANSARADSLVDGVNFSIDVEGSAYGDMSISNNDIASASLVNVMNNQVSSGSGGEDGSINFLVDQQNGGPVTSTVSNIDMSMSAASRAARDTLSGDMSVANNTVSASALGNAMNNQIVYDGNNAGAETHRSLIAGAQSNTGNLTASVSMVDMSVSVPGTTSSSVGVRNNSITASAVANSATNIIRMR